MSKEQAQPQKSPKKPYKAPALLIYGNATDLTSAVGFAGMTLDGGMYFGINLKTR